MGLVLQFAGTLIMVPAVVSMFLGDTDVASSVFLMSVALLANGFFMNTYGERSPLNLCTASVLVLSSCVVLSLYGTIPYLYLNFHGSANTIDLFVNSFFESVGGFTTAGLSFFQQPQNLPDSFVFFRAFTQWVGGLSFIYLIMAMLYPESTLRSMRGFVSGKKMELRELYLAITLIFGVYVAILTSILFLSGSTNTLHDVSLILSGLSTGGFLVSSEILPYLNTYGLMAVMASMILGAISFSFHYDLWKRKFSRSNLLEVCIFMAIMVIGALTLPLFTEGLVRWKVPFMPLPHPQLEVSSSLILEFWTKPRYFSLFLCS